MLTGLAPGVLDSESVLFAGGWVDGLRDGCKVRGTGCDVGGGGLNLESESE